MTGDMEQRAWSEEEVCALKRTVKVFDEMFINTFNEHCDSSLHNVK